MSQVDAVVSLRASHGPVVDGEGYRVPLSKRHDLDAALHAWPLLGEGKLTAREIFLGLGQQHGDLDRKNELTIKILVQAIVVPGLVLQQ